MKCDVSLPQGWYRFTGQSGTRMATSCVKKHHCGTQYPGWLRGNHPSTDEGQVARTVCFTKDLDCCYWSVDVNVRNCSGFYVYEIDKKPDICTFRFCGNGPKVYFKTREEGYFHCDSRYEMVRKRHRCNNVEECTDGSDEKNCENSLCRDESANVWVGSTFVISSCTVCTCINSSLQCTRTMRINYPAYGNQYLPNDPDICNSKSCNVTRFLKEKAKVCEAIEFRPRRDGIKLIGDTWTYKNCTFGFTGPRKISRISQLNSCPQRIRDQCYVYNGGICCATKCQALQDIGKELRQSTGFQLCSNGLQLSSINNTNCIPNRTTVRIPVASCKDEQGNEYLEDSVWQSNACTRCACKDGLLECEIDYSFDDIYKVITCKQPGCNVWKYIHQSDEYCKVCEYEGKFYEAPAEWKIGGIQFYCRNSNFKAGCDITGLHSTIKCSGSYTYYCTDMKKRTRLLDKNTDRYRVEQKLFRYQFNLGTGDFKARCLRKGIKTSWDEQCLCEDKVLVEQLQQKILDANVSTIQSVLEDVINSSNTLTNTRILLQFLDEILEKAKLFYHRPTWENDQNVGLFAEVGLLLETYWIYRGIKNFLRRAPFRSRSMNATRISFTKRCWLMMGSWIYNGPILAMLSVNLVLFFVFLQIVFSKLSQRFAHDNLMKARKGIKCVAALFPLLGLAWLLGFTVDLHWVLTYIFIVINSSQGSNSDSPLVANHHATNKPTYDNKPAYDNEHAYENIDCQEKVDIQEVDGIILTKSKDQTVNANDLEQDVNVDEFNYVMEKFSIANLPLGLLELYRSCFDFESINEPARALENKVSGQPSDRNALSRTHWYRLHRITTSCPKSGSCGTQSPGWLNGQYPSREHGINKMEICYRTGANCCASKGYVFVRQCYGYYVFKFDDLPTVGSVCTELGKSNTSNTSDGTKDGFEGDYRNT
ncbi:hypothetical protein QZH41_019494 [Actinostola sp. cb2023]|nr:hypothetical protein QZH41_019494 [Actinostola sp. cb2023]